MRVVESDITIIGGGLTGLCIAYFLRSSNLKISIVEARHRLGGRIETSYETGQASLEKGATWLGEKHTFLTELLEELEINTFEQELGSTAIYEPISTSPPQIVSLPPNNSPSYRIKGGSSRLINRLLEHLDASNIYLNQVVHRIEDLSPKLGVQCEKTAFHSPLVISTLPPNLLSTKIAINPFLPTDLLRIAKSTHTWMGDSIKVGLRYEKPFWRSGNLSGTIVSNVGPIPEMYDHSNSEDTSYALKGFLNGSYYSLAKEERLEIVLSQLEKYYGKVVRRYLNYEEAIWRNEPYTYCAYNSHVLPHQHNGHFLYQNSYLDNRLIIGGSETALEYPGYMEGAIRSAKSICTRLVKTNK